MDGRQKRHRSGDKRGSKGMREIRERDKMIGKVGKGKGEVRDERRTR